MINLPISPLSVHNTTAKKQTNGMYILYRTGTKNKVFDVDFKTPKKAKEYYLFMHSIQYLSSDTKELPLPPF